MKTIFFYLLVICLSCSLFGCGEVSIVDRLEISPRSTNKAVIATIKTDKLTEVAPPQAIQELGKSSEKYHPQVSIVNPKKDKSYTTNEIEVQLKVKDLPIFKNEEFGLGSHLNLILDNEPARAIYNLEKPLVLENLTPGTHTIRVLAARPWDESFKNNRAYAQTTFHVLTKTDDNNPDSTIPLLTYNHPNGTYGAEPIMLDFYLNQTARKNLDDKTQDLFIRVTVNGESFIINDWYPIYLEGFKRGNNWVQLELLDEEGNNIDNAFNNTIRLITYEPKNKDTLAKLITGELSVAEARGIVEENYQPETISLPEEVEAPMVEPETLETEEIELEVEPEVKSELEVELEIKPEAEVEPKSSANKEETTQVKSKVNYTPPAITDKLNPVTEEVVETREPTLNVVPIPEKSEEVEKEVEKTEETEAILEMSEVESERQIEQ